MEIVKDTLDDLLYEVYGVFKDRPFEFTARRGKFSEIFGVLLELKNPRARISRSDTKGKLFSALGELLWYLDGSEKLSFIKYYIPRYQEESENGKTIYGAYGPRFFQSAGQYDQIKNVIALLSRNKNSRRATIQLFESRDIAPDVKENNKTIPCTCTLQFLQRDNKLNMITFMRSNDIFLGLSHDIFAFTMLQELIAKSLNLEVGVYKHSVGSLHLYEEHINEIREYIGEGLQSTNCYMKPMPSGDQWDQVQKVKMLEALIREDRDVEIDKSNLDSYWIEIAFLLDFYRAWKNKSLKKMIEIREKISDPSYTYILDLKIRNLEKNQSSNA